MSTFVKSRGLRRGTKLHVSALALAWLLPALVQAQPAAAANSTPANPGTATSGSAPAVNTPEQTSPAFTKPGEKAAPEGAVSLAIEKKLQTMISGQGLTSSEVARRAEANSKQLAAKQQEISAANASVDKAKAGYLPSLKLAARYTHLSKIDPITIGMFGDGNLVFSQRAAATGQVQLDDLQSGPVPGIAIPMARNQYALTAVVDVPLSDYVLRVSHGVGAAKLNREAAVLNERATRLAVNRDARIAYYEWIRAQGAEFVGDQSVAQATGHLGDAEHAFAVGLSSHADTMRAKSALKAAELFRQRTIGAVRVTTERLRVFMGDGPDKSYEVGENILQPPRQGSVDTAAGTQEARGRRLELQALEAAARAVRTQADVVRAANYPRLDAQGRAQYSNPNERYFFPDGKFHATWDVSAVLSWTPTDILGASAAQSELTAKAASLDSQRQELVDALQLEVTNATTNVDTAQFALTASKDQLDAAEENYRVRRELFRAGRGTSLEITDAETELTRARLEVVNAYVDWHIAAVQLEHALGRDVH